MVDCTWRYFTSCLLLLHIEFLVHSPRGLDVCEPPLLVRLFAATISDVVLHRQLRSYPLAIELLEALPGLVPSTVQEEPSLLSQLIVDMKTQVRVRV